MGYVLKRRLISTVAFVIGFPVGAVGMHAVQESLVGPEGVAGNPGSVIYWAIMGILIGFLFRSIALVATGTVDPYDE